MPVESLKRFSLLVNEAFALYRKNWQAVFAAYSLVFLVSFSSGVISFLTNAFSLNACSADNELVLLLFCLFPWLGAFLLSFFFSFLNVFVLLSVLRPIQQVIGRTDVSSWADLFPRNFFKSIKVACVRLLFSLLAWLPFFVFLLFGFDLLRQKFLVRLVAPVMSFFGGELIGFPLMVFFCYALLGAVNVLLMFFELEYALNKRGLVKSLQASVGLVSRRPLDCFLFGFAWWLAFFAFWLVELVPTCFSTIFHLLPVLSLVWAFFVLPVQNFSLIFLWNRLSKISVERPAVEITESPDEYLEQLKSKMVLSWQ
ncbi:hypothetical protein HY992_03980 [Candidatus Micrarchaeota archaeon]|nr:hypothetical protein [Candidatus Micrarchaeota archaeon]